MIYPYSFKFSLSEAASIDSQPCMFLMQCDPYVRDSILTSVANFMSFIREQNVNPDQLSGISKLS